MAVPVTSWTEFRFPGLSRQDFSPTESYGRAKQSGRNQNTHCARLLRHLERGNRVTAGRLGWVHEVNCRRVICDPNSPQPSTMWRVSNTARRSIVERSRRVDNAIAFVPPHNVTYCRSLCRPSSMVSTHDRRGRNITAQGDSITGVCVYRICAARARANWQKTFRNVLEKR